MARYRLINAKPYRPPYKQGEVYEGTYTRIPGYLSVKELAELYPKDWQLVEDNFELPEKWYVKPNNLEEAELLGKWYSKYSRYGCVYSSESGIKAVLEYGITVDYGLLKNKDATKITFEQFKKYVLGMEDKKIVGYKLIRPEYYKAASTILFGNNAGDDFLDSYIPIKSDSIDILIKADVLDLWFKPVYEEEFKIGDWVVVLPEDEFYHNSDKGKAQKICNVKEGTRLPYKLKLSDGSTNSYRKVRKATPGEIEAAQRNKLPVINDYEGKVIKKAGYGDGILEYGCAKIPTRLIRDIYFNNNRTKQSEDLNRKVASITLDSGVTITWEQIQQIVDYLNNK